MSDIPTSSSNKADKSGLRWSRLQYVDRKTSSTRVANDDCFKENETRKHFFVELRYSEDRFVDLTLGAVADEIMLKTDELLSRLPRVQRERVIGILDTVHQIRLDIKDKVVE